MNRRRRRAVWEQAVKPVLFSTGIAGLVYAGGANWKIATAAGLALLGVLWTIWNARTP